MITNNCICRTPNIVITGTRQVHEGKNLSIRICNLPVARFTERLITYLSPKTYLTTHLRPKTCLILKICIKTCHKSILVVN